MHVQIAVSLIKPIAFVASLLPSPSSDLKVPIGKGRDLSYRDRLIKLRLLPRNYWLEYLDLVFLVNQVGDYVSYCSLPCTLYESINK